MLTSSSRFFSVRVAPKDHLAHLGTQREKLLKRSAVSLYNKRFRSWAVQKVRQYTITNSPVILNSKLDYSQLTDKQIASGFQKAAALRKHDLKIWNKLGNRTIQLLKQRELDDTQGNTKFNPVYLGYVCYGIGKSRFYSPKLITAVTSAIKSDFDKMNWSVIADPKTIPGPGPVTN